MKIVTMGAVLIDPEAEGPRYWGCRVPDEMAERWQKASPQCIGRAELLPVITGNYI